MQTPLLTAVGVFPESSGGLVLSIIGVGAYLGYTCMFVKLKVDLETSLL